MIDPDDLVLSALFGDVQADELGSTQPAFTQVVMARVLEQQSKRQALKDTLRLAGIASAGVLAVVLAPLAWPQIQASFEAGWLEGTLDYRVNGQFMTLAGVLLLSAFGWAVAVKD